MNEQELVPHLFRTEYSKITAVLCKYFGIRDIQAAEDIASETFVAALNEWPYRGIPANPIGWLYRVARNKALNHIRRRDTFQKVVDALDSSESTVEPDLSEANISDSQLRMLFAICHPSIPPEAQIGLALRILCGFGIDEIATAFLTNRETINKRLYRAKEKLRSENVSMEVPSGEQVTMRINAVLTTLYLLFNEGYYSETNDAVLREDFCAEAMRLTHLLASNPSTDSPEVNALLALMYFHASRFPARKDNHGDIVLYHDQDEALWNKNFIARGAALLHKATEGTQLTRYHLEATIAYWHTVKSDTTEKWENILQLYNRLLTIEYSPIAALNRTYALSKVRSREQAIAEAEKLRLDSNPYYFSLLGELYGDTNRTKARENLEKAFVLAKTQADKDIIKKKLDALT